MLVGMVHRLEGLDVGMVDLDLSHVAVGQDQVHVDVAEARYGAGRGKAISNPAISLSRQVRERRAQKNGD